MQADCRLVEVPHFHEHHRQAVMGLGMVWIILECRPVMPHRLLVISSHETQAAEIRVRTRVAGVDRPGGFVECGGFVEYAGCAEATDRSCVWATRGGRSRRAIGGNTQREVMPAASLQDLPQAVAGTRKIGRQGEVRRQSASASSSRRASPNSLNRAQARQRLGIVGLDLERREAPRRPQSVGSVPEALRPDRGSAVTPGRSRIASR